MSSLQAWALKALEGRKDRLTRLMSQANRGGEELREARRADSDPNDQASDIEGGALSARLSEREFRELEEINAAIARASTDTYGLCEECGGAIGRNRLHAIPEARRCTTCVNGAGRERIAVARR